MLALPPQASGPSVLRRHRFKEPQPVLHTVNPHWGPSCPHSSGLLCPRASPQRLCPGWRQGPTLVLSSPRGLHTSCPQPRSGRATPGTSSPAALAGSSPSLRCGPSQGRLGMSYSAGHLPPPPTGPGCRGPHAALPASPRLPSSPSSARSPSAQPGKRKQQPFLLVRSPAPWEQPNRLPGPSLPGCTAPRTAPGASPPSSFPKRCPVSEEAPLALGPARECQQQPPGWVPAPLPGQGLYQEGGQARVWF